MAHKHVLFRSAAREKILQKAQRLAFDDGVRLFAVDCEAEVEKVARAAVVAGVTASDVKVFCRILCDGAGAECGVHTVASPYTG